MFKPFLIAVTLLLAFPGCLNRGSNIPDAVTPLQVRSVSWDHSVGTPRIAFALLDGPEPAAGVTAVTADIFPFDTPNATPTWSGNAVNFSDYEIPYWVIQPTLTTPGYWGIRTYATLEDGRTIQADFVVDIAAESAAPTPGELAPPSLNRTLATEPDLSRLSSGANPDPAFYQLTVAEAVASGKPTVVGFITPGLCETKWCAPVLDSVAAVKESTGDAANFIHIEVYDDFQALTLVPQMAEWGLGATEPWVFVLDRNGRIDTRFNGPLSPQELSAALQPLLP